MTPSSGAIRGCWAGVTLLLAAAGGFRCASPPPALLPLENWGDLAHPYGDSLEAQAWEALGPRPAAFNDRHAAPHSHAHEPVRLGAFYELPPAERAQRADDAEGVYQLAIRHRTFAGADSLALLLDAIRIDPAHVTAYEVAGAVLLERHEFVRARALAVQGLRLEPGSARLWAVLAGVYLHEAQPDRAARALRRGLELDAGAIPDGARSLAVLESNAGHWTAAESLLAASPQHAPGVAQYIAGRRALAAGDVQAARDAFAAAAAFPDAQPAMFVELGNAEYALGHHSAADAAFTRALELDPGEPAALTGRGVVQRALGHPAAAVPALARVAALRPRDGAAQFNLAGASLDAAQRAGRGARADSLFTIAEQAFSACIDLQYQLPDALERRAHLRLRRGAPAAAAADAGRLLEVPTHRAAGQVLLARAALAQKDAAGAVRALTPATHPPQSADALFLLGKAYAQLGRHAEAAAALQRAHALDPQDRTTAMNLGVELSESGQLEEAERVLRSLVDQRPSDSVALQNLAAVLQRRGRRAEAQRLLERVGAARSP